MKRLTLAVLVSIPVAGLTAAHATPGLPSERPSPEKQPHRPKTPRVDCTKNAVTEHKPWLSSVECAPNGRAKPPGGSCRWADECLDGLCVDNGAGGGVCAKLATETANCTQAMGAGDATATWVGGVVSFACAGNRTLEAAALCTLLPKRTAKPACANGSMAGHSCGVDQPCTTTEMCRDDLECVKAYPHAVGKCAARVDGSCPGTQATMALQRFAGGGGETSLLCVAKELVCQ